MNLLATKTKGGTPRKSKRTVHHHQEAVWKVWKTREISRGQGRKACPWWRRPEEEMDGALWRVTKQTSSTGPARYHTSHRWLTNRLWFNHQEGNIPGHQRVEKWQVSRTWQYFSKGLKMNIETSVELLYSLFKNIWEEEQVPSEWKEDYVIKLPKDDLSTCTSHRGITLFFFFFFCVPQLYLWGSTLLDEIFACVTVF